MVLQGREGQDTTRQAVTYAGPPAAVEIAKALVNMKLTQAPMTYPSDTPKAKSVFILNVRYEVAY